MASASTTLVVVPSPALSPVRLATSTTILAPMFWNGWASSISLATLTPSRLTLGPPKLFCISTLRPVGPMVTLTALASCSSPLRSSC